MKRWMRLFSEENKSKNWMEKKFQILRFFEIRLQGVDNKQIIKREIKILIYLLFHFTRIGDDSSTCFLITFSIYLFIFMNINKAKKSPPLLPIFLTFFFYVQKLPWRLISCEIGDKLNYLLLLPKSK